MPLLTKRLPLRATVSLSFYVTPKLGSVRRAKVTVVMTHVIKRYGAICTVMGFFPLCYGASQCFYPSGLCRDMAAGLIAYRMQMGRAVRRGDEVNIFDTGPDVEVATVAAQPAFFSEWSKQTRERLLQTGINSQNP
jgi:hypothetical protein